MVEQTTDVSSQSHQSDLKAECVAGGWGGMMSQIPILSMPGSYQM